MLRGIFGTIKIEYQDSSLDTKIQEGNLSYMLDSARIRKIGGGLLFECKVYLKQGDKTLGIYKIIGG